MNGPDPRRDLEIVTAILPVCGNLSTRDRLLVLQMAWLSVAGIARTEALGLPGGFPVERARQVEQLNNMADVVSADEPDLEMERLLQGLLGRRDEDDAKGDA